ncbi:MAG: type II toxin-antitoxin system Phd/YefM family antitoxin [Vulcanimicrobiota bacterium]
MSEQKETVAISKFKATCLELLKKVRQTGQPIVVTRRGVAIAEIIPPTPETSTGWLGALADRGRIVGDIVAPVDAEEWEVLQP